MKQAARALALLFVLSIAASIPGLNLLALGYLFGVEGAIAREGRLGEPIPLFRNALPIASSVIVLAIAFGAAGLFAGAAEDARLFAAPGAKGAGGLMLVFAIGSAGLGVALVLRRVASIRLEELTRPLLVTLRLGLEGALVILGWALPVGLLFALRGLDDRLDVPLALAGAILFAVVALRLPAAEAAWAATRDLSAGFAWSEARELTRRAPLSFASITLGALAIGLPLYLTRALAIPPDARWITGSVFILVFGLTRILYGFAYRRAKSSSGLSSAPRRLIGRVISAGVILAAWATFLAVPDVDARGALGLLAHPAFSLFF